MRIVPFSEHHIEEASRIARTVYEEERLTTPSLPLEVSFPDLLPFAQNGLGMAAFEGGRMLGFLCGTSPFPNAFHSTDAVGVFSPMGANGVLSENRRNVYARLLEACEETWKEAGASSHALCLYAHDKAAQEQCFYYGFGIRCMDALRLIEAREVPPLPGVAFRELPYAEFSRILPLEHGLDAHMAKSPTFILRPSNSEESLLRQAREQNARYFAAETGDRLIAFLKIARDGETFVCEAPGYLHITGAYCLPEYRGKGVYKSLLQFVTNQLAQEGFTRLGVDFESINPAGYGFWRKHFQIYTHSVTRRIDEHVLKRP